MSSPRRWWRRMDAQRRQVARVIADHVGARWHDTHAEVTTLSLRQCVDALLFDTNRFTFDVHAAREWATSEAALADEPIDDIIAVAYDWRESRCSDAHPSTVPGLPPCAPHDVLNWRARAKVGRLVLDMLDGRSPWARGGERQSSECPACCGRDWVRWTEAPGRGWGVYVPCDQCRGTGHNLRGRIPEIDLTPPCLADGSRDYARLVWKAGDVARAAGARRPYMVRALAVERWLGCTRDQADTLIMLAHVDGFRGTGRPASTDERPLAWITEVQARLDAGLEVPEPGMRHTRLGRRDRSGRIRRPEPPLGYNCRSTSAL